MDKMEIDLISKKELLELTGISYGQLYRWKRKNLIPEEWFIRKSTFTGQETFFDKNRILDRINKIKNMKDDFSLDDIADVFSPQLDDLVLDTQELIVREIVSPITLEIYTKYHGEVEKFNFDKILSTAVLDKILQTGSVSLEEGKTILQNFEDNSKNYKEKDFEVIYLRKFGVGISLLSSSHNQIYFDSTTNIAAKIKVSEILEELKRKLLV